MSNHAEPNCTLFAYGTLMFEAVWSRVLGQPAPGQRAFLRGHRRMQVAGKAYPALVAGNDHDVVEGMVYMRLSMSAVEALDRYEGECYVRKTCEIEVPDPGQKIRAEVYIWKNKFRHLLAEKEWNPDEFARLQLQNYLRDLDLEK